MIGFLWSAFSRISPIIAIGLGVSLGIADWNLHGARKQIASDATTIAQLQVNLTTCHNNTVALEASVTHQNAAVQAIKTDADAAAARGAREIRNAQFEVNGILARADRIARTPATSSDVCIAAHERIRNTLAEERR
jgi:Tfp pilus assembly major pilin PilA